MLTTDDIRSVPLFATLSDDELDHLAHTSADLHLPASEFAVHEGGERALYVVLTGKMEVIKTLDGIERTPGWRLPGTIFGEVPLALSSPFPGAYRAAEPSRVMRVDAQRYYELAAASPAVAFRTGALARERIGGLQGLSAEPPEARVTMATGVTWRRLSIEGFDRFIGKGIYCGASRGEANATHGLDVYLIGGGNSAGQAALYFAHHARTVTLVLRGDSLEKSTSRYLIEQLRAKSNVAVRLQAEVVGAYGDTHLTAIDVRDASREEARRQDCGALFVFIGADAQTNWLPEKVARDARGYVLTGDDVVKAGCWSHNRDP